jgi:hypothetical protein
VKESQCGSGPRRSDHGVPARAVLSALLAVFLLCLALFPGGAAAKSWEVTGTFGGAIKASEINEETQLNGVSAFAVNYTGAGGVPKGTVYAATHANGANRIARFTPVGSGLKFVERWEIVQPKLEKLREENLQAPYKICGPAIEDPSEGLTGEAHCSVSPEASQGGLGIAVDQTTGNIYVGDEVGPYPVGEPIIRVYTPNGSSVVARFGEQGPVGQAKLEAETPNQLHSSPAPGWLTVNNKGEVYAFDVEGSNTFYHRLMVFKPEVPGNYTKYVYAGASADIGAGFLNKTNFPEAPVLDQAGNVYVKSEQAVEEYNPATPGAAAICSYAFSAGGISALTVDPKTGEPIFYSYRKKSRRMYELSSCAGGHFALTGEVAVKPERSEIYSLGFDPTREFSGREPGAVYAGAAAGGAIEGAGEGGPSGLGYILAQPAEAPPVVSSESVSLVGSGSATLEGEVDPRGFETRYAFQYATEASYLLAGGFAGAAQVGGVVNASSGPLRVVGPVAPLEPDTAYVSRLIAMSNCSQADPSKECVTEGKPLTFHTYPVEVAGPPDGRAYELVSPAQKGGGQVLPANPKQSSCAVACKPGEAAERFPAQSSPDGSAVVYQGEPFGTEGAAIENEYLSRRTSSGWATTDPTPSLLTNRDGNGYKAFSPTLDTGVFGQGALPLSSSALAEYRNMYVQSAAEPSALSPVLSGGNATPTCSAGSGNASLRLTYAGASASLGRLFFEANDSLIPTTTGVCEESNLYEWSGGALRSVNVPPGGSLTVPKAVFGSGRLLRSGNVNAPSTIVSHAISEDGTRAFFTGADGHLYVRVDGVTTQEVPSLNNCKEATPLAQRVCFLTAAADGSKVLLSDGELLALNGSGGEYEVVGDLTGGSGGFLGIAGQSEDLNLIYFVDTAILTGSEANDHGAVAISGQNNLYAWIGGQAQFVAVLDAQDGSSAAGDWTATPVLRTSEASPDGRWLAFLSVGQLTGYKNVGPCIRDSAGNFKEAPCTEAYVYDSQSESLTCASCNPSGSLPVGPTTLTVAYNAPGYLPQPRYLANSGRLIFGSGDSLVPGDTNGHIEDVYEFEPSGVGGCTRSGHCLSLVSTGHGSSDSNFLTMDQSGDNVFFTTRDQLVKSDTDQFVDLYDARVGGGVSEPAAPTECTGEACQAPAVAPVQSPPSSMGIAGESKPKATPKKCKKGQVKRQGRCVKSQKKKKAHHGSQKAHKNGKRSKRPGAAGHKGGNR